MAQTTIIINPRLNPAEIEFLQSQTVDGTWLGSQTYFPYATFGGTRGIIVSVPAGILPAEYEAILEEFTPLIGRWTDCDGTVYLDLSIHVLFPEDHTPLLRRIAELGEIAYWDVAEKCSVNFQYPV